MKKTTIRLILFLLLFSVMISAGSVLSFAEEASNTEISPEESAEKDASEASGEDENIFSAVYDSFTERSEEIFSFFAFIGTLIIAFVYKKGLLPNVKSATGYISDALKKINEERAALTEESRAQAALIENCSERVDNLSAQLSKLSLELEQSSSVKDRRNFCTLLEAQIELLRDVFLSSSLPHYQKEAVEAKIKAMKEAVKENEENRE